MIIKKTITVLMSICFLSTISFVYAQDSEYAEINTYFSCSMEEKQPDSDSVTGEYSLVKVDDEHGYSMAISSAAGNNSIIFKGNAVKSEADIVSFDLYCKNNDIKAYTSLLSSVGEQKRMFYIRENGTITVQQAMQGEKLPATLSMLKRTENKWYHLDVFIDYNRQFVSYYIDGKNMGNTPLPQDYTGFEGFNYMLESTNGGGVHIIDNVSVIQILERGKPLNIDSKISFPSYITTSAVITDDCLGSIFFDQNVSFYVNVKNNYESDCDFVVEYEIVSEHGIKEYENTKKITVSGNEEEKVLMTAKTNGYGFYTINAAITNQSKPTKKIEVSKAFSVANAPEKGVKNTFMGVCNHFNFGHGINELDRKTELFANAGFVGIREGYLWSDFEKVPGQYSRTDIHLKADAALNKYGLTRFAQLALGNSVITPEVAPVSDYAVKSFAEYAYQVALQSKGTTEKFELWNEWNITGPASHANPNSATVSDYVNLLKKVYPAVKKGNPNALLYGLGGVANTSTVLDWIEEFLELGGGEYCDGFTIHPYTIQTFAADAYDITQKCIDLFKKYGYADKPVVITEFNWTSGIVTEDDQANYAIQYASMIYGKIETLYWYVSQEKQAESDSENKFGMIRAWEDTYTAPYEPFSAKPEFLALSNWNAMMTDSEALGKIELEDKNIEMYKFKTKKGEDVAVIWNNDGTERKVGLKLDTDKVKLCDKYGTGEDISLVNSVLNLSLTKSPIYIIGNFDKTELCNLEVAINVKKITTAYNDEATLVVKKTFKNDAIVLVTMPENITLLENNGFNEKNEAVLKFSTGDEKKLNENIKISVINPLDGSVYASYNIGVEYKNSVGYKIYANHFRSRRWQCNIMLENTTNTRTVSGKIKITEPDYIARYNSEITFSELNPLATKEISFAIPENVDDVKCPIKGTITLDNGEKYEFNDDIYFAGFAKAQKPPVIDGRLEVGEWNYDIAFRMKYPQQVKRITDWKETEDIGGKVYTMWDNDYFYIAGAITDNILGDKDEQKRIWSCDSIQFSFAQAKILGGKRTEYGIGLIDGVPTVERYSFMVVDTGVLGIQDSFSKGDIQLEIRRDEDKKITYYEARFPWEQIFGKKILPTAFNEFYFSMLVNDNDGKGRRGWIEYCPGIGESKNTADFVSIPIIK